MSLKYALKHPDTIRKAITGGVTAGLAALANAIVEVSANGVVTDPAFHVSSGEWGIVAGAVLAGLTAVYAVKNRHAVPEAEAEVREGEAEDLPEGAEEEVGDEPVYDETQYSLTNPEVQPHRPIEF